ncbi:MAG: fructose-bisphosphate aldolase [Parcubacteria group bacterium RIFCSPLOWO2_01_FULL_48_18]|nr:MAG: fructose-bisphosphate aldolase [Parcubacteria group bacterium RIFCSPLOWO2_01_FULL_48_18]OHB24473.1 MAG: fructose-bisphosphate aldolase [Parcubacteria group bacterium RIFCSPHIGHO2_02_FULL_48_10b]
MNKETLVEIAQAMVAPGKGIIAADESSGTCQKRFDAVGVPCTEENRRAYREVLFGTRGLEEYISGVILFDETIKQKTADGIPFPKLLADKGIMPGIKVDAGAKKLAFHSEEKVTEGLDGLRERLADYAVLGARFAKWRAVITIGPGIPSRACIHANAHALARYAALCQEAGIVPIVEPEVLIDGDHTIEQSYEATSATLKKVFEEIAEQGAFFEGIILKASMVIAGKGAVHQSTASEVAEATIRCLLETAPRNLAGVVFLSGGQSDEQATAHLNAMNQRGGSSWPLSFSYSRAIQNPVLKIWAQDHAAHVDCARDALLFRARMNSLASQGKYSEDLEKNRPY